MKITSFHVHLVGFGLAASLMLVPVQTFAHHSFASEFDINKPIELTGTVTVIRWTNPHGRVLVDIEDENGEIVNWDFELPSVNQLIRRGWKRNDLKPGDKITLSGHQARDDRPVARARVMTRPNGDVVFGGGDGRGGRGGGI